MDALIPSTVVKTVFKTMSHGNDLSDNEPRKFAFCAYTALRSEKAISGPTDPSTFLNVKATTRQHNDLIGKLKTAIENDLKLTKRVLLEAGSNGLTDELKSLAEERVYYFTKGLVHIDNIYVADWNALAGKSRQYTQEDLSHVRKQLFTNQDVSLVERLAADKRYAAADEVATMNKVISGIREDVDKMYGASNDMYDSMLQGSKEMQMKLQDIEDKTAMQFDAIYDELIGLNKILRTATAADFALEEGQIVEGTENPLVNIPLVDIPTQYDTQQTMPTPQPAVVMEAPSTSNATAVHLAALGLAKPNAPRFVEGKTDLDTYFAQCERYYRVCGTHPELWIDVAMMQLSQYINWYEQHAASNPNMQWDEFKHLIKSYSLGENVATKAMTKLLNARQGSNTLPSYCKYFLDLTRDAKVAPDQSWVIHKFLLGLTDSTLKRTLSSDNGKEWSSLTELIQKLTAIAALELTTQKPHAGANQGFKTVTSRFNRSGTSNGPSPGNNNTNAGNSKPNIPERPRLFALGANRNPSEAGPSNRGQALNYRQALQNNAPKYCQICRRSGHDTLDCWNLKKRPAFDDSTDNNNKSARM
jgi:hypothetical protein